MNCNSGTISYLALILIGCLAVASCGEPETTTVPAPAALTRDDTGYFCGMIVEDHLGPKSQVILRDANEALWFTTARDGIAFMRLPEETRPVEVFYVSAIDLGGWDHPEADPANMVRAAQAWFVIESEKRGSMGAPEAIPFSSELAAGDFVEMHGGRVLSLADIPDSYILGPEVSAQSATE